MPPSNHNSGVAAPCPEPTGVASQRKRRWLVCFVTALGLIGSLLYIRWQRGYETLPWGEEPAIALHLARGHGYRSPIDTSPASPPTAWSPPVYPYLMAGVYRLLGIESLASRWALLVLHALSLALAAGALTALAARHTHLWVAALAGVLLLLQPVFLVHLLFYWDTLPALAMFLGLLLLVDSLLHRPLGAGHALLLGGGLGVLALTNPSYILSYPLLVALPLWRRNWTQRLRFSAITLASFALVLLPWTIRNLHVFGQFMFVRAGAAVELRMGNVSGSNGLTLSVMRYHPFVDPTERARIAALGETDYFKDCRRRFARDYSAAPAAFWLRSVKRAVFLLVGNPREPEPAPLMPACRWRGLTIGQLAFHVILAAAALLGVLLAWQRMILWPLWAGAMAIAPFLFTHVHERYALPLRAVLLMYVAMALGRLACCAGRGGSQNA